MDCKKEIRKDERDRTRALYFTSVLQELTTSKLFLVTLDIQGGMFKRERRRARRDEKLSFVDNTERQE